MIPEENSHSNAFRMRNGVKSLRLKERRMSQRWVYLLQNPAKSLAVKRGDKKGSTALQNASKRGTKSRENKEANQTFPLSALFPAFNPAVSSYSYIIQSCIRNAVPSGYRKKKKAVNPV